MTESEEFWERQARDMFQLLLSRYEDLKEQNKELKQENKELKARGRAKQPDLDANNQGG